MVNRLKVAGKHSSLVRKPVEGEGAMGKAHSHARDDGEGNAELVSNEDEVNDQGDAASDSACDESLRKGSNSGWPCQNHQTSAEEMASSTSSSPPHSVKGNDEEAQEEEDPEANFEMVNDGPIVARFIALEVLASLVPSMCMKSDAAHTID